MNKDPVKQIANTKGLAEKNESNIKYLEKTIGNNVERIESEKADKSWKLLRNQTSIGNATITVDVSLYSEFLIESGLASGSDETYYRILASTIVPKSVLTYKTGVDHDKGTHQAYYSSSYYGGISYTATNEIKIYNNGGITRLYAR